VVATAGHLVFQILNDGRLLAYTAEDGKRLLEIQTDLRGMGPPISYQVDGKQQISFLGGSGLDSNATPPRMFTFALAEPATLP
jgi:quinohemoprotein ethanol dehydrogenase